MDGFKCAFNFRVYLYYSWGKGADGTGVCCCWEVVCWL
jgi:hypothetical protein